MSRIDAYSGASIFDGEQRREGAVLLVQNGQVLGVVPEAGIPPDCTQHILDGGLLAPGFVDLQVNGGGGVLFNEHPDVEAIATICAAHAPFGTTALLPTLITDTPEIRDAALQAGIAAARAEQPGFLGLHLEGPHLSVARKGAHDPALIRPMNDTDLTCIKQARQSLPFLMTTVAPESVTNAQIAALSSAGILVSLGHTEASFDTAAAAAIAGAGAVTHLFNAMSPLGHREPGLVGAALHTESLSVGLIADGIHVHPAAISIALAAKRGPGRIFLITDAMSTIGTDLQSFSLNGRTIRREGGRLVLEDGTLAGADLDMISAVRFMVHTVGVELDEALRMASLYPAACLGADTLHGHLKPGAAADMIHLDEALDIRSVWLRGRPLD
uniref:N-acetylglucosamine-6-phosphate deacetylase n=1 Tax=Pararhizobium sp. IMCC3301 TaxID=3067904 RepID=UPI0027420F26|nr:N-acetylglucosamine-6-phosphate deacetylase [Pararhizobium sp. IMCC3301]